MTNKKIRRSCIAAAVSLFGLAAGQANAGLYDFTWHTDGGATSLSGGGLQFTGNDGMGNNSVLKARAYATSGDNGSGDFISRTLGVYSGGLGVNTGSAGEEPGTTSPNHALDNVGKNDVILFEFASANFDPTSVSIGWYQTDSDVEVWVGGNGIAAGWNLAQTSGNLACSGACDRNEILNTLGFTLVTSGLDDLHTKTNGTAAINTTATGRYMIVTGRFNGNDEDDYVKIDKLTASFRQPPNGVPEPGALGLLGLGLAALGWSRRRAPQKSA